MWSRGVLPAERKTAQRLRAQQRAKTTQPKRNGRLKTERQAASLSDGLPDLVPMSCLASHPT